MECMVVILKIIQAMFRLEIATTTVTNLPNVFSLVTKNSVLVLTLATRFLYDLDLNGKSEVKTNISSHLALLCLRNVPNHKKKKNNSLPPNFTRMLTSDCNIFKQSNVLDWTILHVWAVSFTLYKLATKNLYQAAISPVGRQKATWRIF